MRTTASCCFTPGAPWFCCRSFTQTPTSNGRVAVSASGRRKRFFIQADDEEALDDTAREQFLRDKGFVSHGAARERILSHEEYVKSGLL